MDNYLNRPDGGRVDVDRFPNGWVYQCVDYVVDALHEAAGLPYGGYGNAIDYATKTDVRILRICDKIAGQEPVRGDITVLSGLGANKFGHIGIATGHKTATAFEMKEQNGATGGGQGLGGDAIRKRMIPKNRIVQILRLKGAVPATPAPTPDLVIVQPGFTMWQYEENNQLPHGTLQNLNPGVNPKTLAIGQQLRVRGAAPAPVPAPVPAVAPAEEFVTAQQGFTMWQYEKDNKLSFGTLQRLNPGVNPRTIQIGQKIRVR